MPFDASGNFTRNYNFVQDASTVSKSLLRALTASLTTSLLA
jgi:hypothetical protein